MSALDIQVGGEHYKSAKIQPVQYIEANNLAFLEGCVVKRVTRHNKPTGKGRQDIEKAIHELQLLLELRYGEELERVESDWITFGGAGDPNRPKAGDLIEVRHRDGSYSGPGPALSVHTSLWNWIAYAREGPTDIVAWRYVK